MLTIDAITKVATRIEQAYLRRHPLFLRGSEDPKVWAAAASSLLALHRRDESIPVDPELFVASQPVDHDAPDPWAELTRGASTARYRRRVRRIIRALRGELLIEVRKIERRIEKGLPLAHALASRSRKYSPLGRYLVAYRAGRPDLADLFRPAVHDQHLACPLYREACAALLPRKAYPVPDLLELLGVAQAQATTLSLHNLN